MGSVNGLRIVSQMSPDTKRPWPLCLARREETSVITLRMRPEAQNVCLPAQWPSTSYPPQEYSQRVLGSVMEDKRATRDEIMPRSNPKRISHRPMDMPVLKTSSVAILRCPTYSNPDFSWCLLMSCLGSSNQAAR